MPKVLILGAGSSHGHGAVDRLRPPLSNGFFTDAVPESVSSRYGDLRTQLASTLGLQPETLNDLDIEEAYQRLEPAWWLAGTRDEWLDACRNTPRARLVAYIGLPALLTAYVYDVVSYCTGWIHDGDTCPHHDRLAAEWLVPGDTVVNFNYDMIMWKSLRQELLTEPIRLVHPHGHVFQYGVDESSSPLDRFGEDSSLTQRYLLENLEERASSRRRASEEGSGTQGFLTLDHTYAIMQNMGWGAMRENLGIWEKASPSEDEQRRSIDDYLRSKFVDDSGEVIEYEERMRRVFLGESWKIVSPSPYKNLAKINEIWGDTSRLISEASEVYACGFSFRDVHFNEVLRQAARTRRADLRLTAATPDKTVISSVTSEFRGSRVEVVPFIGSLEDFAASRAA